MKIKIEESNGVKKYWVNDVAYNRLEDIPAEFREYFIDKNNNGIPDQFDDLMDSVKKMEGGASLFEIFGTAKGNAATPQSPPKIAGYSSESEKPSIMPTVIKIVVGILVIIAGVLLYPRYREWRHPTEHPEVAASLADSTRNRASATGMKLVIEDLNQAPYHMLGVVYEDQAKRMSFELPAGETSESSDTTLTISMNVEPGTNLGERTFSLLIRNGVCSFGEEEFDTGKVKIGKIEFNKSEQGDAGAGQRYQTYRYAFEKNGECLTFSLMLRSGNPQVYDPPVKEFDLVKQKEEMEKTLKTISVF